MKKLFFTAITLIAISSVSNAKIKKNKIYFRAINCECVREDAYYSAINNGATVEQANGIAMCAYVCCGAWNRPM